MKTFEEIKEAGKDGTSSDLLMQWINEYIDANPNDDKAILYRGLKHWSRGERSLAINDYLAAIRINPDSDAKLALETANGILDFYNKDLYNP